MRCLLHLSITKREKTVSVTNEMFQLQHLALHLLDLCIPLYFQAYSADRDEFFICSNFPGGSLLLRLTANILKYINRV